ncbi:MAG: type II secretion system protein [Lachnospiraceae bacterium]|jgi:prepilin-type N-terminal cleavage/methylation domain-containing protein|nr:type II secretion system protein [Lachnospiraceae bacterium]
MDKNFTEKNSKERNFLHKIRTSKKGFTLVEVIVAFALTGILFVAASAVFGVFLKSFVRVTGISEMETAARSIMETVTGELERAAGKDAVLDGSTPLWLAGDGTVWYRNFEGKTAHMLVDESGELLIAYYEDDQTALEQREPELVWQYSEKFYDKCYIHKLETVRIQNQNLLEVTLEMKHRGGDMTYSMTRIFACYNLEAGEIA